MDMSILDQVHVDIPVDKWVPDLFPPIGGSLAPQSLEHNGEYAAEDAQLLFKNVGLGLTHIRICCISLVRDDDQLP